MKDSQYAGLFLLLARTASFAAPKCPAIDSWMLDKGFSEADRWRVVSGGPAECSFATRNTSANVSTSLRKVDDRSIVN